MTLETKLSQFLAHTSQLGLYRTRSLEGSRLDLNFSSNDYLSLCHEPEIKKGYLEGFKKYPTGSGGSMVICGYHEAHQSLEQAFIKVLQVDECLLFPSGYTANLSIASLLSRLKIHAVIDKNVHASIYDGLKLSGTTYTRYLHQNTANLEAKLNEIDDDKMIMTESIFSMSGQKTSLDQIHDLAMKHKAGLIIDEAHAFGIIGREGLGAVVDAKLSQYDVPLRIIPFGKALAGSGAVVVGERQWIEALLQCARSYIYSTAISPAMAFGLEHALTVVRKADERRKKLQDLVHFFRDLTAQFPYNWRDSHTPIQQLQLGCPQEALELSLKLKQKGIYCQPIRQPTVSKKETGLRIILNYRHEPDDLKFLFKCLDEACKFT